MGLILLPSVKLKSNSVRGKTFEQEVHEFLVSNYSGYTVTAATISGYWRDSRGDEHYGEHREYRVALINSSKIEALEVFIAQLAEELDEECIYIELREEAALVYRSGVLKDQL